MSEIKKCDRCGAEEKSDSVKIKFTGFRFLFADNNTEYMDLCEVCRDEIRRFIKKRGSFAKVKTIINIFGIKIYKF